MLYLAIYCVILQSIESHFIWVLLKPRSTCRTREFRQTLERMYIMRKRSLAAILTLVLTLGMCIVPAAAAGDPLPLTVRAECVDMQASGTNSITVYPGSRVTLFAEYSLTEEIPNVTELTELPEGYAWEFQWHSSKTNNFDDAAPIPQPDFSVLLDDGGDYAKIDDTQGNSKGIEYIPNTSKIGTTYYFAEMTYTPKGSASKVYRSSAIEVAVVDRAGENPLKNYLTVAEASGWLVTTPSDEVVKFYEHVAANSGGRVRLDKTSYKTELGTTIPFVIIGDPAPSGPDEHDDKAVVLFNANIHSGEVEGKEALMILTREFAMGMYDDILKDVVILAIANMNPDGNDAITKRPTGPRQYTPTYYGARNNQSPTFLYNINRDMMKLETHEGQALVSVVNDWNPDAFGDLHATNGSRHRIPLEVLWNLHPDADADLAEYNRTDFVDIAFGSDSLFGKTGKVTRPYGDFSGGYKDGGSWVVGADEKTRYTSHYIGLRNSVSFVFEVYSHDPYTVRVDTQYMAVRSFLEGIQSEKDTIKALLKQADERELARANKTYPNIGTVTLTAERTTNRYGTDKTYLVDIPSYAEYKESTNVIFYTLSETGEIISDRDALRTGSIYAGEKTYKDVVYSGNYETVKSVPMGAYYLFESDCTEALEMLQKHGVVVTQLTEDVTVKADVLQWYKAETRGEGTYEGRTTNAIVGEWKNAEKAVTFPKGTYVVSTAQINGTLASLLMEPEAPDSLVSYTYFLNQMTNYEGKIRADYLSTPTAELTETIAIPVFKLTSFSALEIEMPFTDVNKSDWFYEGVNFVYQRGLFNGVSEKIFSPGSSMTRAMFATVLARLEAEELKKYDKSIFSDVDMEMWYGQAVEWAAESGIVNGVGDNRFAPDEAITREQMATMLNNYVKYKKLELPSKTTAEFADANLISTWAAEAVKIMHGAEIINGKSDNLFDPLGTATRSEVATLFMRYMKALD